MTYNITEFNNLTEFIRFSQTIVPFFGPLILMCVAVVSFLALKAYETHKALAASMFVTLISAVLFFIMGLVGLDWVYLTAIMTAISVILLQTQKGAYY